MLYKVILTFESVDEILKCDHSNESYWAVLSRGAVYYTAQLNTTEQYFPMVLFIMLYKVVLTFESVGEILQCDHSNESYWAVPSCGTVYYAVQGDTNFWVYR